MPGRLLIGTCSWTDPSLIEAGTFYPREARAAEARLAYYASQFSVVEIDASYYAIPSVDNAERWVARTPDDFTFDIKAYGLFTLHPAQPRTLPRDLLLALPEEVRARRTVYVRDLSAEIVDALWERYLGVLHILKASRKLGVVIFQFPPWFIIGRTSEAYLAAVRRRLEGFRVGVEFRGGKWMDERHAEGTLDVLREMGLGYVCVDEPVGLPNTVPPVAAATTDYAVVRFHGRNRATWNNTRGAPSDRFDYYYERSELETWAERIFALREHTSEVHLLMNTNKGDQGVVNARLLAQVLGERLPPSPRLL